MTYSVLWSPQAERELLTILGSAPDTGAITGAVLGFNHLLRTDPDQVGESWLGGRRVTFLPPLGVRFEVRWRERAVLILHVWRFRPKGPTP